MVADSWSYHQNTTRLTASRLGSSSMFRRVRPARLILLCWKPDVSDRHERAAVGNWNARPRSRESQRLSGIPGSSAIAAEVSVDVVAHCMRSGVVLSTLRLLISMQNKRGAFTRGASLPRLWCALCPRQM